MVRLFLDTYKIVQLLEAKGYSKEEAEGFIEAIQEITLSGVASKQDIADLKEDISDIRKEISDLRKEISDLRKEMSDLRKEISDIRKEISDQGDKFMHFVFANTIAIIGIFIAVQFIPH